MSQSRKKPADLFGPARAAHLRQAQPLAARMRPRDLDEFVGQEHFLGPGKLLRRLLLADRLGSLLFYGPPGSGKTALAHVIAQHTKAKFVPLNATASGIKEVREALEEARRELEDSGRRTILFVDEMHRFNRSQQDVLLPDVEEGRVVLIGATTQNPFFAINSPLLSRSQIFLFEPLGREAIKALLRRALADTERGLGSVPVHITDDALDFLAEISDGDARRALIAPGGRRPVGGADAGGVHARGRAGVDPAQGARLRRDRRRPLRRGQRLHQEHARQRPGCGDLLAGADAGVGRGSALHRPARGDPGVGGRGQCRSAGADAGGGGGSGGGVRRDAGVPAAAGAGGDVHGDGAEVERRHAGHRQGPRGRAASGRTLAVPKHLRDSHYRGAEQLGHGEGYEYSHDYPGGWVDQAYLPEGRRYYEPIDRGFEAEIRKRMEALRGKQPPV